MTKNSRLTWFEQPSYTWPLTPGDEIHECYDCGPFWRSAVEADPTAPYGLSLREWHTQECYDEMVEPT